MSDARARAWDVRERYARGFLRSSLTITMSVYSSVLANCTTSCTSYTLRRWNCAPGITETISSTNSNVSSYRSPRTHSGWVRPQACVRTRTGDRRRWRSTYANRFVARGDHDLGRLASIVRRKLILVLVLLDLRVCACDARAPCRASTPPYALGALRALARLVHRCRPRPRPSRHTRGCFRACAAWAPAPVRCSPPPIAWVSRRCVSAWAAGRTGHGPGAAARWAGTHLVAQSFAFALAVASLGALHLALLRALALHNLAALDLVLDQRRVDAPAPPLRRLCAPTPRVREAARESVRTVSHDAGRRVRHRDR